MDMFQQLMRRGALGVLALGLAAGSLAGCGSTTHKAKPSVSSACQKAESGLQTFMKPYPDIKAVPSGKLLLLNQRLYLLDKGCGLDAAATFKQQYLTWFAPG